MRDRDHIPVSIDLRKILEQLELNSDYSSWLEREEKELTANTNCSSYVSKIRRGFDETLS